MKQKYYEQEIYFNVGPARVWDALTNPEKTRHYMYGCSINATWEMDSPVLWETEINGQTTVVVKGILLNIVRFKLLSFTVFVPDSGVSDMPENHITLTYTLNKEGDGTRLLIKQGDYAKVDNGDFRYEDTAKLWSAVTNKLIELAEGK
jgi:uncharacterized protein YndB with AHSA1/START domain